MFETVAANLHLISLITSTTLRAWKKMIRAYVYFEVPNKDKYTIPWYITCRRRNFLHVDMSQDSLRKLVLYLRARRTITMQMPQILAVFEYSFLNNGLCIISVSSRWFLVILHSHFKVIFTKFAGEKIHRAHLVF